VGLAEVENKRVLDDLLASKHLSEHHYDYVHFNSPDERGIDVAMIYDTDYFEVISTEVFPVNVYNEDGSIDYTRDILLVEGLLDNECIYVLVNHWPSRRDGATVSESKRIMAAKKVSEIIESIKLKDPQAKIIVMGDFNDDPFSNSIEILVNSNNLYNPMNKLLTHEAGTTIHNFKWNLFDQILFSTNFFETGKGKLSFQEADLFDEEFLKQFRGRYKGTPFRTYVGKKYKGGYSDHFPVYILLNKD